MLQCRKPGHLATSATLNVARKQDSLSYDRWVRAALLIMKPKGVTFSPFGANTGRLHLTWKASKDHPNKLDWRNASALLSSNSIP
jgi:hypothetical protein